jgi:hypothetical protein
MIPSVRSPDEDVDEVLVSAVDEGCDIVAIEVIKPPSFEWEVLLRQVLDHRPNIHLSLKPWLDDVLVRASFVDEVFCLEGTHVSINDLSRQEILAGAAR